ncbi:hypothetical protein LXA43DRAFT_197278 [Ganoderma leucocontextum]|nr:hypothetical protein LXA43DRAFT_197278 [Ganoderma leucocontextum]
MLLKCKSSRALGSEVSFLCSRERIHLQNRFSPISPTSMSSRTPPLERSPRRRITTSVPVPCVPSWPVMLPNSGTRVQVPSPVAQASWQHYFSPQEPRRCFATLPPVASKAFEPPDTRTGAASLGVDPITTRTRTNWGTRVVMRGRSDAGRSVAKFAGSPDDHMLAIYSAKAESIISRPLPLPGSRPALPTASRGLYPRDSTPILPPLLFLAPAFSRPRLEQFTPSQLS